MLKALLNFIVYICEYICAAICIGCLILGILYVIEENKWSFLIIGIIVSVLFGYYLIKKANKEQRIIDAKELEDKRKAAIAAEQKKEIERLFEEEKSKLITKYGAINKIIIFSPYDINICFILFGEKSLLYIQGYVVEFSKIISYEIFDDYTIKRGAQVANSKSKKSAGGTVLLGTAGALIGGASGAIIGSSLASTKTSTTISGGEDNIHHNFILSINIKDINKPLIKLHIGNNIDISMEINAIMTYIMELNK
ncbi:MAG: hypothetical protein IKY76_08415 [Alistipes sp.]|nr:hypothetical protein [Alistipes sp.]